ncbi:hypothetical protein P7C70_g5869, partial [Phenoliferia sp. Uapishka_3]
MVSSPIALFLLPILFTLSSAVKFDIVAAHSPVQKCLWNYAMSDTLVVISVSSPLAGTLQRLDMEIIDGSGSRNVYQAKKGLKGETRMAITTHADADLGVCFQNKLDGSVPEHLAWQHVRSVDLDVDIGADAVDYNAIAKQESLSGLEVEMRKLEGVVKEIVDELNYLKRREARMRDTNAIFFRMLQDVYEETIKVRCADVEVFFGPLKQLLAEVRTKVTEDRGVGRDKCRKRVVRPKWGK